MTVSGARSVAAVVCSSVVDDLVDSRVWERVACVRGSVVAVAAAALVIFLGVEASVRRELMVETAAAKVSSSVRRDLSVTAAVVVVAKASVVVDGAASVRASSVLPWSVGGAVVKPKSTACSLGLGGTRTVPAWFKVLKLWTSVDASVDRSKDPGSVLDALVGDTAGDAMGGVDEIGNSWRLRLCDSVTRPEGVKSDVISEVNVCWFSVEFLKVSLDDAGRPVSDGISPSESVCSVASMTSVFGTEMLRV